MGALTDITVVEVSLQLPGPYASMLLQQLGARVIKIEPPGGDVARILDIDMYEVLNEGKEVVELNLREPGGRSELHRLCADADVFVEGFRPGVVERLGADYQTLAGIREGLVYCSMSGYGQTGPYRAHAGHDINYLGVSGGVAEEDGATRSIGLPVIDLASGTTAALAIVAALRRRDQEGVGGYLDVAMLDVAVFWSHIKPQISASAPAYGVFRAGDGAALSLAALEDKFWRNLCDVLGWDEWKVEFAEYPHRAPAAELIAERLESALLARPRDAWLKLFTAADVPAAPVHEPAQTRTDSQVRERELFNHGGGPVRSPLPPELLARVKART